MLQAEVIVTPGFETWVFVGTEGGQCVAAHGVKVLRIFFKAIVGREVHATAKPADRFTTAHGRGGNHAHVHVHRGHIRVARVKHQRHTHGLERCTRQFRAVLCGRRRQLWPADVRKPTACPLEHRPTFQDACDAAALQPLTCWLGPSVFQKCRAIDLGNGRGDACLQTGEVGANRLSLVAGDLWLRGLGCVGCVVTHVYGDQ